MNDFKDEKLKPGQISVLRPFGPTIGHVKIPEDLINKLNNYTDEVIKNEKKSDDLDHGKKLAGNVTQEFKLEKDFMKEVGWIDFLAKGAGNWIKYSTGETITKFDIISSWVVRQFQNEYNPVHWHGGHISGVGYLKVPKTLGKPLQKAKNINPNGNLQLIHGTKMFLSNSEIKIIPEVGNFYFFPNYMMHTVYPFSDTNEERRSISFNAWIDSNIFDVYGSPKI
tara:strand:+ start:729 stop:1400 length:672 start_codon:yes stop_codon:yes gene_type:complete